jgi:hypothetical protein
MLSLPWSCAFSKLLLAVLCVSCSCSWSEVKQPVVGAEDGESGLACVDPGVWPKESDVRADDNMDLGGHTLSWRGQAPDGTAR